MRIHSLTMSGIGPYAGTETIDFDAFGDCGRFLLTGPTGSGKTTIIDAIVFALYGDVADSSDSSKDRMRSTLVGPEAGSCVELVFSTTAGIHRVRRTPAYERAKRRGQGTTIEHGSVKLWRLSAVGGEALGEPVIRVGEADAEIARLIGLSREQFTQTVVLPQGKFARFLRADSTQRQGLLKDVFGTGIYDAIQDQLAREARAGSAAVERAAGTLSTQARSLAREPLLAPQPMQDPPPEPDPPAVLGPSECLGERLEAATATAVPDLRALRAITGRARELSTRQVEQARDRASRAAARAAQARQAQEEARSLHERLERRRRLLAEQRALEEHAQEHAREAERLHDAERAARLAPSLRSAQAAQERALDAVGDLDGLTAAGPGSPRAAITPPSGAPGAASAPAPQAPVPARSQARPEASLEAQWQAQQEAHEELLRLAAPPAGEVRRWLEGMTAPVTAAAAQDSPPQAAAGPGAAPGRAVSTRDLDERAHRLRAQHGGLEGLLALESHLGERAQELSARREELELRAQGQERQAAHLAERPQQRTALAQELEAARAAQERLPGLEAEHRRAGEQHRAATTAQGLAAELTGREEALAEAAEAATRAAEAVARTRMRWISSQAGALAGELVEGEPCPVCGSTDHPEPAAPPTQGASRAQVEAAERVQHQADEALSAARQERDSCRSRYEEARRASEGLAVEHSALSLQQAATALSTAQEEAERVPVLAQRLEDFDSATEALRVAHEQAASALAASRSRLEAERDRLVEDQRRCEQARGPWPSVAARAADLLDQARQAEEASRAISTATTSLDALQEAREDLARTLAEEGFTSAEQARSASVDAAARAALAQRVQEARSARERIRHALADPLIAALTGQEEDALEQADEALAGAEAEHEAAAARHARAAEAHAHLERACTGVEEAASAHEEAVGASAALLRVAALARGDNPAGTTLATWVLQERFEEVLVFANERLAQMSSGRYELIRTDEEAGSRSRRKGLGLAVIDHLGAEHRRDPKTLSGGETFYVSLSLALALADVVSAESGGVSLDTLFIDEGFGSLDPETLQVVMAEIERLRAGGRSVGIVSHVEELKSQIPDQIRIRRSPAGGSTLAVST
ncbi:AAA family ATPase [Actinomyces bowdenii]|uniref:Nuclease SbcCD subunit C n=1 Tax=Actinomyces bowdenii TaxID=131109 RepID=A0A3P1V837_9ACTO|nr:SMC family ATPase [Actinomyces bowdenii]RRD30309.1 SMC family ATPase [Actinomyces bowdenii]